MSLKCLFLASTLIFKLYYHMSITYFTKCNSAVEWEYLLHKRGNAAIFIPLGSLCLCPSDNTPLRSSLVAEANIVELFREEPEEELGFRIVGGKDTPLGNIVIQEILRDSLAGRDGRLAPGDHILEVRRTHNLNEGSAEGTQPLRSSVHSSSTWEFKSILVAKRDPVQIHIFPQHLVSAFSW